MGGINFRKVEITLEFDQFSHAKDGKNPCNHISYRGSISLGKPRSGQTKNEVSRLHFCFDLGYKDSNLEYWSQSPVPYRLAIAQCLIHDN